jgi:hypothetical protein
MKTTVVGYINPNGHFPTLAIAILEKDGKLFGLWPSPKILELKESMEELVGELKSELIPDFQNTEIETDINSPSIVAFALNATDIQLLEIKKVKDHIKHLIESTLLSESDLIILKRISNEF